MSIESSPHAKKRLKMRRINEKDVLMTLRNSDKILFDEEIGNFIAVGSSIIKFYCVVKRIKNVERYEG